ncbi:hypothetical protein BD770DRAFT_415471 [Pilaira anomala]|nr:hypothetical protein BD770DRAFT_415471 [Pilaira anomala]
MTLRKFKKKICEKVKARYLEQSKSYFKEDNFEPIGFYRTLLILNLPWRNEETELLEVDTGLKFNVNNVAVLKAKKEFCTIDDEVLESSFFSGFLKLLFKIYSKEYYLTL